MVMFNSFLYVYQRVMGIGIAIPRSHLVENWKKLAFPASESFRHGNHPKKQMLVVSNAPSPGLSWFGVSIHAQGFQTSKFQTLRSQPFCRLQFAVDLFLPKLSTMFKQEKQTTRPATLGQFLAHLTCMTLSQVKSDISKNIWRICPASRRTWPPCRQEPKILEISTEQQKEQPFAIY